MYNNNFFMSHFNKKFTHVRSTLQCIWVDRCLAETIMVMVNDSRSIGVHIIIRMRTSRSRDEMVENMNSLGSDLSILANGFDYYIWQNLNLSQIDNKVNDILVRYK